MRLSARSRYAARILIELAKDTSGEPVPASALSELTGVSVQFVEQILKPLKRGGFTKSRRGAAGGHMLARPADDITLGQVIKHMENGIYLSACCNTNEEEKCMRKEDCPTRHVWQSVSQAIENELDKFTLTDLLVDEPKDGRALAKNKATAHFSELRLER